MRRLLILLVCLAAWPVFAQQSGQRPGAPPAASPTTPPSAPTQERAANVMNRAVVAITTLYVSSTEEDNWGSNRLAGQPLPAGRSFQVRLGMGRHCRFDLQAVYSDGKLEERRDQDLCRNRQVIFDGSKAVLPADRTERKIILQNRAPRSIKQVFISAKNASNWGDDVLSGLLARGEESELTYRGECVVDLRVVFDNSSAEERREADICDRTHVVIGPGWTTTDEIPSTEADLPLANPAVATRAETGEEMTVVNVTGRTVEELYVFPEGAANEGPDRFGSDVVEDGGNHRFRLDRRGACHFTVRGVYANSAGDVRLRDVDLCASTEIRLETGAASSPPASARPASPAPAPQAASPAPVPTSPPPAGVTRLRNAGAVPIVAMFADPAGSPRSTDRLGDAVLDSDATFDLALPVAGQCRYRITVIYRNGRNAEADADLCATRELTLP